MLFQPLLLYSQSATQGSALEYRMKAAYVVKFMSFVRWPEGAFADGDGTISVGVLGSSPILGALTGIQGTEINGRALVVRHFPGVSHIGQCHLLFIPESEGGNVPDALRSVGGQATLTVGESARFLRRGGMIRLYVEANRMRFEVDSDTARREGLTIEPALLELAGR